MLLLISTPTGRYCIAFFPNVVLPENIAAGNSGGSSTIHVYNTLVFMGCGIGGRMSDHVDYEVALQHAYLETI